MSIWVVRLLDKKEIVYCLVDSDFSLVLKAEDFNKLFVILDGKEIDSVFNIGDSVCCVIEGKKYYFEQQELKDALNEYLDSGALKTECVITSDLDTTSVVILHSMDGTQVGFTMDGTRIIVDVARIFGRIAKQNNVLLLDRTALVMQAIAEKNVEFLNSLLPKQCEVNVILIGGTEHLDSLEGVSLLILTKGQILYVHEPALLLKFFKNIGLKVNKMGEN